MWGQRQCKYFQNFAIVAIGAVREAVGASRLAEAVVAVSKADGNPPRDLAKYTLL